MTAFDLVTRVHEELDEDQSMIAPHQLGLLLIDWTNPQKATSVYGRSSTR
jgi:condensin complex subunit 3